jgi:hypothetical protein
MSTTNNFKNQDHPVTVPNDHTVTVSNGAQAIIAPLQKKYVRTEEQKNQDKQRKQYSRDLKKAEGIPYRTLKQNEDRIHRTPPQKQARINRESLSPYVFNGGFRLSGIHPLNPLNNNTASSAPAMNLKFAPEKEDNVEEKAEEINNEAQQSVSRAECFGVKELKCYRKTPLYAQHMLWNTSGIDRFEFGDTEIRDKASLMSEIKDCTVTTDDIARCIRNYKKSMDYASTTIHHCAVCGRLIMHQLQGESNRATVKLQN